jgi:hypothetical protein
MLTAQVENLRSMARDMFERGNMFLGVQLRDAADTIENLRNRLQEAEDPRSTKNIGMMLSMFHEMKDERETCHDTGDERIFHCSECGFGFSDVYLSDEDYLWDDDGERIEPWPPFCPNCGRKVVE